MNHPSSEYSSSSSRSSTSPATLSSPSPPAPVPILNRTSQLYSNIYWVPEVFYKPQKWLGGMGRNPPTQKRTRKRPSSFKIDDLLANTEPPRDGRNRFTPEQTFFLRFRFCKGIRISSSEAEQYGKIIGLNKTQIRQWFIRERVKLGVPENCIVPFQLEILKMEYSANQNPSPKEVKRISKRTNLKVETVLFWFVNKTLNGAVEKNKL